MVTLAVNVTAKAPTTAPPAHKRPRASLAADGGVKLTLPFAPREATLGGWGNQWDALERPGRLPLVRRTAAKLPTLSFTVLLARRDHQTSVEDLVATLRNLAESRGRIVIAGLSAQERGPWRLDDVTVNVTNRRSRDNAITRATADLSFVYAYDAHPKVGPVSGGHHKPKPSPKHPKAGSYTTRHYTVRKGDTCRKIATRFYGIPGEWKRIAKANHIAHPNAPKVGRRIVIPPLPHPVKKKK